MVGSKGSGTVGPSVMVGGNGCGTVGPSAEGQIPCVGHGPCI